MGAATDFVKALSSAGTQILATLTASLVSRN